MRTPGLRKDVSLAASCFTLSLVAVCLLGVQPGTATAQVKSPSLDQTLKQCPGGVAVAPGTPCPSSTPVGWQDASLAATDIGVGSAGHVFFIATDGSSIWQHTTSGNRAVPGRAVRIAVAPNGHPWVVNVSGEIYRDVATADGATTWKLIPGWASDIGIGVDGTVWVLGGGGRPYRWDDTKASWVTGTGIGTAIAVDPGGNPWVVNASGEIYQFVAGAWKQLPKLPNLPANGATDIAVANDGTGYVMGSDGRVWKWASGTWVDTLAVVPGGRLSAGPFVYVVSTKVNLKTAGAP